MKKHFVEYEECGIKVWASADNVQTLVDRINKKFGVPCLFIDTTDICFQVKSNPLFEEGDMEKIRDFINEYFKELYKTAEDK